MDIGYARVSTKDQHVDLQVDALRQSGCEKIFSDIGVSGSRASRPGLDKALDQLRDGDTLVVWRLDRLGRGTRKVLELLEDLDRRNVKFRSLSEAFDTSGPIGRVLLTLVVAFAEMERDLIRDRTNAGLEAARARGRRGGRKLKLTAQQDKAIRQLYDARNTPVASIAESFHVSEPTVWRSLARTKSDASETIESSLTSAV
jgi:DNA invertase Pin-like site-specific DNA recombinase